MKKRLLTLSMVGLLSLGLTSCATITGAKDENGSQIIVTIKNGDTSVPYTADQLLKDYAETETGIQAYYNAIYDILIRHEQDITYDMEIRVDEKIDTFVSDCKTSASTNGTTYQTELSNKLEAEGVENLGEYRELVELEIQKEKYKEEFYEKNEDNFTSLYIEKKMPYHIRHILVKTDDVEGSSVYEKKISKDESIKISSIISRLAEGESFGDVAYDASDDTSNSLYGSVGIMDKETGFVSEFKYGIYYYDAYLSDDSTYTTAEKIEKLSIPTTITSGNNSLNTKDILEGSVSQIPYSIVLQMNQYADSTKTINNASHTNDINPSAVRKEITETWYPRNVLFNTYFNNHGLAFITDTGIDKSSSDYSAENWITPEPEIARILGTGTQAFNGKILADNDGNPIIVTYNPSTGLHFMIIEKSPLVQKYSNWTDKNGETHELESLTDELLHYYSTDVPSGSDDVTNNNRYVTYIKSTRNDYLDRAHDIEDLVNAFDSNMDYRIFESLIYDAEGNDRTDITIDETILKSIKEYIKNKREQSEYTTNESNVSSWNTYLRLLQFQEAQKDAKQLDFNITREYFVDTKTN